MIEAFYICITVNHRQSNQIINGSIYVSQRSLHELFPLSKAHLKFYRFFFIEKLHKFTKAME